MTKIKEKICLFFFLITCFFSFNSAVFADTIEFDPAESYGVRSEPQPSIAVVQPLHQSQIESDASLENPQTFIEQFMNFLKSLGKFGYEVFTFIVSVLVGTVLALSYFGAWMIRTVYSMISGNVGYYKENGWFLGGLLLFVPALGMFGLVSRPFLSAIKTLFKSGVDMQVRTVLWLGAFGSAGLAGISTKSMYDKYKENFERKTGWQLGPLKHDAMWVGGFLL